MTKLTATTDRRVLRTRRTLRDALIELIAQRGWDAISVSDVCERADVGRSTFYTHFADKEELLLSGFDDLHRMLRALHPALPGSRPLAFAGPLIEHAGENLRIFRALVGKRSGHAMQKRFRQTVVSLVTEDLAHFGLAETRLIGTAHYLAGAYLELLTWWIDSRTKLAASELEQLFHQLTTPVIESLISAR